MVILKKDPRFAYFDTFTFQGKEYEMGANIKVKQDVYDKRFLEFFLCKYPRMQLVQSYLDHNNKHRWKYAVWFSDGHAGEWITDKSPDEIIDHIDVDYQEKKIYKDSEVNGVIVGWFIYIFVMIFSIIFRSFIILWIFATVYFFCWRKDKLTIRPQIINKDESEGIE